MSNERRATRRGVSDYGRRPSVAWVPVGWKKVETFEGIFKQLARPAPRPRILCGDFNTSQAEWADGTVITWGQLISDSGAVLIKRRIRGGPAERWDAAERSVLTGLVATESTHDQRWANQADKHVVADESAGVRF